MMIENIQGIKRSEGEYQVQDNLKLIQLIEMSRHGARSPFYDLWDYRTNWNMPLQTLTSVGQRQHYLIGQELYRKYSNTIFNHGQYKSDEISVQSTSSDRAQQSALSQLYGIYQQQGQDMSRQWRYNPSTDLPPMHVEYGKQILEELERKNLPNSYVPINVQVNSDLLSPSDNCHGYDVLKALNFQTDVYKQFDQQMTSFKQEFIEKFQLKITVEEATLKLIANYWDSVICDIYEQIPLPENFNKEFIDKMNFIYDFQQLYIDFNSDNGNLLKIQTTQQMNDIIDVVRNQNDIKFKFYSGSDGNINAVLIALGHANYTIDFNQWLHPLHSQTFSNAPFASTIFFEIYLDETTNKKYIKVIYNGKELQIPGCKNILCDFENEFVPFVTSSAILPNDIFESVCQNGY